MQVWLRLENVPRVFEYYFYMDEHDTVLKNSLSLDLQKLNHPCNIFKISRWGLQDPACMAIIVSTFSVPTL